MAQVVFLTWPVMAAFLSVPLGLILGFLGPIYHVSGGNHLIHGGISKVLKQAIFFVSQFWLIHGMVTATSA